jgi:hypothetical protein
MGVIQLEWNIDGTCLFVRLGKFPGSSCCPAWPNPESLAESAPLLAHIYSFLPTPEARLPDTIKLEAAILFSRPISAARWNPQRARRLAICTHDTQATANLPALGGSRRNTQFEEAIEVVGSGVYVWDGDWENEDSAMDAAHDGEISKESKMVEGVVEGIAVPHRE